MIIWDLGLGTIIAVFSPLKIDPIRSKAGDGKAHMVGPVTWVQKIIVGNPQESIKRSFACSAGTLTAYSWASRSTCFLPLHLNSEPDIRSDVGCRSWWRDPVSCRKELVEYSKRPSFDNAKRTSLKDFVSVNYFWKFPKSAQPIGIVSAHELLWDTIHSGPPSVADTAEHKWSWRTHVYTGLLDPDNIWVNTGTVTPRKLWS